MNLKRLIVSLCIVFICSITFIGGYTKTADIVYADSTTDAWTQVTTNEQLVEAFRYYCKSRDLTIEGSVAGGVTAFTTKTFNGICNTLGIDMTALQAQIKYQTDGNIGLKFLFSDMGVNAYNRIFAQFLQDNNLAVGESANEQDNTVFSGESYTDDEGNTCLIWEFHHGANNAVMSGWDASYVYTKQGTALKYSRDFIVNNINLGNGSASFNYMLEGNSYNVPFNIYPNFNGIKNWCYNNNHYYSIKQEIISTGTINSNYGCVSVIKEFSWNGNYAYVFGVVSTNMDYGASTGRLANGCSVIATLNIGNDVENANVYLTTNNTVINNNTYEGDTIINNNGDIINNPDTEPDNPGTTTPPTNTGGGSGEDDGTITFPDFDFHLPEINWSLGDLSNKFPFSIPFDLIAFFTVLNAEPQAPAIDADIPLGSWYTWHFEADFSQFDNYAVIIRNVEFIGFCVGLIYLTIKLVKG